MSNLPWLVFDGESDAFDGEAVEMFIWGWMLDNQQYFQSYNTEELIDFLRDFPGIALAHNGGKFDILFLLDYLDTDKPIKIINGRIAEAWIGKCRVRDSFLIIPESLDNAGDKDEFDYSILNRNKKHLRKKYKAEIEKYLRQDCRALHALVEAFYNSFGQCLTLPGAALKEWEKISPLKRRWGGQHDNHFRQFYFGGRVSAEQKGVLGGGWKNHDIKSAYPRSMQMEHTACHLLDYKTHRNWRKITPQSFARINAANHKCLPRREGLTTEFPYHDGMLEYFATGWEIIAGLETNTIKIEDAIIWEPTQLESLAEYVKYWYEKKLAAERAGDKVGRGIAKRMMNALYGKFGANPERYFNYRIVPINWREDDWDLFMQCDNFDIVKKFSGGSYYDVALAASITGCQRATLFRQIMQVKEFAYCDTDSIMCKGGHFDIGEEIGQWELKNKFSELYIAGKKLYAGRDSKTGEWITAHKGFSDMDVEVADIINAARGGSREIIRNAPSISLTGEQRFLSRTMQRT